VPEKTSNNKTMKKQHLFIAILIFFHFVGFAQSGFLGKHIHFQFETKFTPAWRNLNFNHNQGFFCFNYNLIPSIEYVFTDKWSVSVQYMYSPSAFKIEKLNDDNYGTHYWFSDEGYFMENGNRYKGYSEGDMTIHGGGVSGLYYFGNCAPAGYYLKLGVDAFFYNVSVPYSGYDTLVNISSSYDYDKEFVYIDDPGIYTARDWAMGIRFEVGRNFFIGRYVSLGASLSCGLLCKGWGKIIYNSTPQFIDAANKRLVTSYIGGISIKIGILPF